MIDKRAAKKIRGYFLKSGATIAVAESVTSGFLQFLISNVADAEKFYQGGITTYNLGQKYKHLQVEPIHAKACNSVSLRVAEQMALNVCLLFCSDWGIGITGYASPVPESGNSVFCYYAICYRGYIVSSGKIESTKGIPQRNQESYAKEIVARLVDAIESIATLPQ